MRVWAAYRTWRRERRAAKRDRARIVDWCEKCNKGLTRSEVWEIRAAATDDRALGIVGFGGTFMTATYCIEHAPPEATRLVP